jgi:integrase
MIHHIPTPPTMADAVTFMETYGSGSQTQDIRKAKAAFSIHGFEGPDFDSFPADLDVYQTTVRRLRGSMPALQALIHAAGISDESYKQFQRAGRRLIESVTGAMAEKIERKSRQDGWSDLLSQVGLLVTAGLVRPQHCVALTALVDTCRAADISPENVTMEQAQVWLSNAHTAQRKNLRKGLKVLDTLRSIDRLRPRLPLYPVTPETRPASRIDTLPLPLQTAIHAWVDMAAREQVEDDRYMHLAERLSESTHATYRAAATLYVQTLLQLDPGLAGETRLDCLFTEGHVDAVMAAWTNSGTHAARTLTKYANNLGALLERNGQPDAAAYVTGLTNVIPHLIEGHSAGKKMSPKVKKWCETLLRDPKKTALFQLQHLEYYRRALETLAAAKRDGFDLLPLSKPEVLAALPDKDRAAVKTALRKARMFGLMAAYAAIALEGAPYRRMNMLTMRHTGPNKTMFLHLERRSPHVVIKFPNEELKNGTYLSQRGEELEAITIENRGTGDHAVEIIRFYLKEIRPLFPEADKTHCLFPPLERARSSEDGFVKGTFYIWLSEASAAIGLPLNSHNFRHGYCSIDINEGRRSMEDLAKILGDTVAVVQRNYAWINAKQSVLNVQQDVARRRAEILKARGS